MFYLCGAKKKNNDYVPYILVVVALMILVVGIPPICYRYII